VHYTWSHTLGTVAYYNPFDINTGYGSLGFDSRHQTAADLVWIQPHKFSNKVVNVLAQGWSVGAKMYIYSGVPFSVTDSKIPAQVNSAGGVLTPLADLINPSINNISCGHASVDTPCFTKTSFATYNSTSGVATPIQTDWGNTAPDSFRGPGYVDFDMNLSRNFSIKEKMSLKLGVQAYNVFNHPNFSNPSGTLSSGSLGLITTTIGPPTSIYGTGQGAAVSGRLAVLTGTFTF
jgi:hypothetical protein